MESDSRRQWTWAYGGSTRGAMMPLWALVTFCCLMVLPRPGSAQCRYGVVADGGPLFAFVKAEVSKVSGLADVDVNISFEPVQARIRLKAKGLDYTVRWVTEGRCTPPFAFVDDVPESQPQWMAQLRARLMMGMPHLPGGGIEAGSVGNDSAQPTDGVSQSASSKGSGSTPESGFMASVGRWLVYGASPGLRAVWPWLCFVVALLLSRGLLSVGPRLTGSLSFGWAGVALLWVLGLWLMPSRWGSFLLYSDELAYLHPGGASIGSLDYYLADMGLPSRVHRLWVALVSPWGGHEAFLALNFVLYGGFLVACFGAGRLMLPPWLALGLTAMIALHPGVLYRFAEMRSYACFLTFSALAQWQLIRMLNGSSSRAKWWFIAFAGLAALDNPLTFVLVVVVAIGQLLGQAPSGIDDRRRFTLSVLLMGLGLLPGALATTQVPHGAGEMDQWFMVGAPVVCLHILGLLKGGQHRMILAVSLGSWLVMTLLVMTVETLAPQPGKIDLWLYPIWFVGGLLALDSLLGLQRFRPAFGHVIVAAVVLFLSVQRWSDDGMAHQEESIKQLHAKLGASEVGNLDTFFLREQDYVVYATSIIGQSVFDLPDTGTMGLPKWNQGFSDAQMRINKRCTGGERFRVIGTRLNSESFAWCEGCRTEFVSDGLFSTLLCQPDRRNSTRVPGT